MLPTEIAVKSALRTIERPQNSARTASIAHSPPRPTPPIACPVGCGAALNWYEDKGGPFAQCDHCGTGYPYRDGVLVLANHAAENDFTTAASAELAALDPSHFWLRARNELIAALLERQGLTGARRWFLDVGTGAGIVAVRLQAAGFDVVGMDMHVAGLQLAARRCRAMQICGDAHNMPFDESFHAAGLFDVIEHVDKDVALLRACRKALVPGGTLIVTVPADMRLWSPYDVVFGHKRRYTRPQLVAALEAAGYRVRLAGYYNFLLWPMQFLVRRLQRRQAPHDPDATTLRRLLAPPPRLLNELLYRTARLEYRLAGSRNTWGGAALIALADKPA